MLLTKLQQYTYTKILKRIFFKINPEVTHDLITLIGRMVGSNPLTRFGAKLLFSFKNPVLEQTILNIKFKNPIGLAAGFDKNAQLTKIIPTVGFGFEEIGSITGEPCNGNPKPRLWRLVKSKSLIVYYGLKNKGCEKIASKLKNQKFNIPIGINVAKTNSPTTCDNNIAIADYEKTIKTFANTEIGDYFTINISCPNTFGGEPFSNPDKLERLLTEIDKIETDRPIFIKVAVDITKHQLNMLIDVADKHHVHGFVIANLTKNQTRNKIIDKIPDNAKGGISGIPTQKASNKLISHLYKKSHGKYIIIGVGGVFSAKDAYKKIKCGASLVQLITGMIFEGPQLIGQINKELTILLKKDGYTNISEAIGEFHR